MNTLKLGLIASVSALCLASLSTGCATQAPGPVESPGPTPNPNDPSCTLIGCEDAFDLKLDKQEWEAGTYTFQLELDGKAVECTGSAPSKCDAEVKCNAPGVSFYGCAKSPDSQAFESIRISGAPKQISLRILRDGSELIQRSFEPKYTDSRPNGPDCEPICRQATESITL